MSDTLWVSYFLYKEVGKSDTMNDRKQTIDSVVIIQRTRPIKKTLTTTLFTLVNIVCTKINHRCCFFIVIGGSTKFIEFDQ